MELFFKGLEYVVYVMLRVQGLWLRHTLSCTESSGHHRHHLHRRHHHQPLIAILSTMGKEDEQEDSRSDELAF